VTGTAGPDRDPYAWLERLGARAPVVQLQQSDGMADHQVLDDLRQSVEYWRAGLRSHAGG
jgi:hypothetical protein